MCDSLANTLHLFTLLTVNLDILVRNEGSSSTGEKSADVSVVETILSLIEDFALASENEKKSAEGCTDPDVSAPSSLSDVNWQQMDDILQLAIAYCLERKDIQKAQSLYHLVCRTSPRLNS